MVTRIALTIACLSLAAVPAAAQQTRLGKQIFEGKGN